MALALFDLDHTLLDGDSNSLWLDYLIERGLANADQRLAQGRYLALYAAERLDIAEYLGFHLRLLAGRPLPDWRPILDEFVAQRIAPRISTQAMAAVAEHRAQGDRVAIVTATHAILASAISRLFDAQTGLAVIAPQAEVRHAVVTGRPIGPFCFREQKIDAVTDWLGKARGDRSAFGDCHFYSDSANDLPLLTVVGRPVAVNPDPRLADTARERGWPTLLWRCA